MKTSYVLCAGFILHLIFLASVFDIYFRTPIVKGLISNPNPVPGAAKRLVLILADGLKADSLYSKNKNSTPFLRSKLENHGSWGVSHTRVPTESRPGVVALAAGIYEDPSAVFKGWKENPVEFDSIFNQSHHTWAWGSPDIVHMFKQGHVETMSYRPDDEDFSGKDSSWKLDEWVFDHVKMFFSKARVDSDLSDSLHKDKIVFFLHLLGLDTAGHTIKPQSKNYQENLRVVDKGVKEIEEVINNFFNDGKTSYVFTADHGMTNWGSHGAGSKDETEVPLLVWGPGVKTPRSAGLSSLISPDDWQLSHLERKDVEQADIVVLLSSLLGCSIPVNSVGRLPQSYLDLPPKSVAELSLLNAKQLLAQAEMKRDLVLRGPFSGYFRPFSRAILKPDTVSLKIQTNTLLIFDGKYDQAIALSKELINLSLFALEYFHNYYQIPLLVFISLSFFGWIALLFCQLYKLQMDTSITAINVVFTAAGFFILTFIKVQEMDWQFYVYCLLPIFLWWIVFCMGVSWAPMLKSKSKLMKFLLASVVMLLFTGIMVASFFQRWVLSLGMLIISLWPLCETERLNTVTPTMLFFWLLSCALVAVFPLLSVIGSDSNIGLVLLSGVLWSFAITYSIVAVCDNLDKKRVFYELLPLVAAMVVVFGVAKSMESGSGLPFFLQFLSWNLLCSPFVVLLFEDKTIPRRLIKLHATILPPYMLMSVRHEGLFLLALCFHLSCWLIMEGKLNGIEIPQLKRVTFSRPAAMNQIDQHLTFHDFRRAALFVFYIFLSFFGTGNIASLNSFEVIWVRCFLSVFSPFTMMILILVKMLIPFVIVSSVFRAINITLKAPTALMFLAVLIICDLMGVHFLHLVTNKGSWLDIGTSISHYVIVQVTVLALVLIYGLASVLTGSYLECYPFKFSRHVSLKAKDKSAKRNV